LYSRNQTADPDRTQVSVLQLILDLIDKTYLGFILDHYASAIYTKPFPKYKYVKKHTTEIFALFLYPRKQHILFVGGVGDGGI